MFKVILCNFIIVGVFANNLRNNNNSNISAPHIPCSTSLECGNGICIDQLFCKCDSGYYTLNTVCDYKQKTQLSAFFLSLFFTEFGGGRFYICNYEEGGVQLGLFLSIICFPCLCCCIYTKQDDFDKDKEKMMCPSLYASLISILLVIWLIIDVVLIALNDLPDKCNDITIPLKSW